jgi:hypothetical protein
MAAARVLKFYFPQDDEKMPKPWWYDDDSEEYESLRVIWGSANSSCICQNLKHQFYTKDHQVSDFIKFEIENMSKLLREADGSDAKYDEFCLKIKVLLLTFLYQSHRCICNNVSSITIYHNMNDVINFSMLITKHQLRPRYLNTYLSLLSSIDIDVKNPDNMLHNTYMEFMLQNEFTSLLSCSSDSDSRVIGVNDLIHMCNKLYEQYDFRIYMVDFASWINLDDEHLGVDMSDWALKGYIDMMVAKGMGCDEFKSNNISEKYRSVWNLDTIILYTYQLTKYKIHPRYTIRGHSYDRLLFLRRFMFTCMSVLMLEEEHMKYEDSIEDNQHKVYNLICWLWTIRPYFSAEEWKDIKAGVIEEGLNIIEKTNHLFAFSCWADDNCIDRYYECMKYILQII